MRDVEGVVFTVFEAPDSDNLIEAMARQGQLYAQKVSSEGKGHDLGPPHLYVMSSLLKEMAKELQNQVQGLAAAAAGEEDAKAKLMKDDLKVIQNSLSSWKEMTREERNDLVPFIRVAKMYKSEKKKLIISMSCATEMSKSMRQVVYRLLRSREEWSTKSGRAPAGHMERELATWLKALLEE